MVHRYKINKRRLFGPNDIQVSAATTTWTSGVTLTQQWTNSNVYPTLGNPNNYLSPLTETQVSNTVTFNQEISSKSIVIPIELKFEPMDYSDVIDNWVNDETQRVINKILDAEKVKYISSNKDLSISFRFLNKTTNLYTTSYSGNGFDIPTEYKFNRFKKSYFRLYFYDGNTGETANLLFTEEIPVTQTSEAIFPLRRLYWDKDDTLMYNSLNNRTIYMEARFFNAKTGQIQTFFNPPTTIATPISITEYSKQSNRGWRTSPIILINPNNSLGDYKFTPLNGVGANTTSTITLSEFILT